MKRNIVTALMCLYCLLLPFEEIFVFSFGSLNKIVGIVLMVFILLAYNKQLKIKPIFYPLLAWAAYMIVSLAWSSSLDYWLYFFELYIVQILFLIVVNMIPSSELDLKKVRYSIILSGIIAASILIFFPTSSNFDTEGRRTIMLFGNTFDPNIIGAIMLFSFFLCLRDLYASEKKHFRFILIIFCAFIVYGIALTGSRGALLSLIFGFVLFVLFAAKDRKHKFRNLLLIFSAAIGITVIYSLMPESILTSRFSIENITGLNEYHAGVHNRYTIWLYAAQLFSKKPLFGYGCGNFFPALGTVYRAAASHNLYVLLLVEDGLFGFSIFMIYLGRLIKQTFKSKYYGNFVLLITMLFMALTLDSITYKYFWLSFIYLELSLGERKYIKNEMHEIIYRKSVVRI